MEDDLPTAKQKVLQWDAFVVLFCILFLFFAFVDTHYEHLLFLTSHGSHCAFQAFALM
jgi:hypothetical protein